MGSAIFSKRLVLGTDGSFASGLVPTPSTKTITVPAGAISEDMPSFVLSVRVSVDPALVVAQSFALVDSTGHVVPTLLVSYDDWSGDIDVVGKVNLATASDNVFTLLYS